MRERDMNQGRKSEMLRSAGKNGQKRKTPAWLKPTKTAANASCFYLKRSAA